jgi:uncharacterized membrane protein
MPELLAAFSAFAGAVAAVLARRILTRTSSAELLGLNFAVIAVTMLPFAPFVMQLDVTGRNVWYLAAIIVVDAAANFALFEAIRRSPLAAALPTLALVPAFSLLFAFWFFPNDLSGLIVVGAINGIALIAFLQHRSAKTDNPKSNDEPDQPAPQSRTPAVAVALLAAMLFGLTANLSKVLLAETTTNPFGLYWVRAIGIAAIGLLIARPARPSQLLQPIFRRGVWVIAQWISFLAALGAGSIVAVTTLAYMLPVWGVGLAYFWLAERPKRVEVIAACGAVVNAGFLAWASSR